MKSIQSDTYLISRPSDTNSVISSIVSKPITILYGKPGVGKTTFVKQRFIPYFEKSQFDILYVSPIMKNMQDWGMVPNLLYSPLSKYQEYFASLFSAVINKYNMLIWDDVVDFLPNNGVIKQQKYFRAMISELLLISNSLKSLFILENDGLQLLNVIQGLFVEDVYNTHPLFPPRSTEIYKLITHELNNLPFEDKERQLIQILNDVSKYNTFNTCHVEMLKNTFYYLLKNDVEIITHKEYSDLGGLSGIIENYLQIKLSRYQEEIPSLIEILKLFTKNRYSKNMYIEKHDLKTTGVKNSLQILKNEEIIFQEDAGAYSLAPYLSKENIDSLECHSLLSTVNRKAQIHSKSMVEIGDDYYAHFVKSASLIVSKFEEDEFEERKKQWILSLKSEDRLAEFTNRLKIMLSEGNKVENILPSLRLLDNLAFESFFAKERHIFLSETNILNCKRSIAKRYLSALSHLEDPSATDIMDSLAPDDMVYIPAGFFTMGNNEEPLPDETPEHNVWLPGYYIKKHVVSMEDFKNFLIDGGYELESLWTCEGWNWKTKNEGIAETRWMMLNSVPSQTFPVHWCNWFEAMAYANYQDLSLPNEAQWEKAARGPDKRIYPWGNEFDENKCTTDLANLSGPTESGTYSPDGDSPYGLVDMAGNLLEWVTSFYMPYPYIETDGRENQDSIGKRVHRGGAFSNPPFVATTFRRVPNLPHEIHVDHGIRLVVDPRQLASD